MYNHQVLEQESITGDVFLWFGGVGGREKVFLISYSCKILPCLYKTSIGRIRQESLKVQGRISEINDGYINIIMTLFPSLMKPGFQKTLDSCISAPL